MSVAITREDFDRSKFFEGIARGIAGALLFALPMFMTMEMWELGFYMDRSRLFLLLIVNIPLLVILSDRIGFERTSTWRQAIRDASIAYGLGVLGSALILFAMGVLKYDQSPHEIIGMIAIQSIPASIGAMLGRSQLGGQSDDGDDAKERDSDDPIHERETSYAGELFLMAVGALFLNLNVAPTEEMILLSYKMTPLAWTAHDRRLAGGHAWVRLRPFFQGEPRSRRGYAKLARFRSLHPAGLCNCRSDQCLLPLDVP
ncbi:hypothetical protein ACQY74_006504 (plasmid) [Rhizobium leguminosarum bv. trifolii]